MLGQLFKEQCFVFVSVQADVRARLGHTTATLSQNEESTLLLNNALNSNYSRGMIYNIYIYCIVY